MDGEVDAGYSVKFNGITSQYFRNEQRIGAPNLHVSVAINSNPARHRFEKGVIGSAVFESDHHVEVELSVEPHYVTDIVNELRRDLQRGFRVDGYAISERVFRVAYFLLFVPGQ